eukprot:3351848-Prymnesium_polylepis.1
MLQREYPRGNQCRSGLGLYPSPAAEGRDWGLTYGPKAGTRLGLGWDWAPSPGQRRETRTG